MSMPCHRILDLCLSGDCTATQMAAFLDSDESWTIWMTKSRGHRNGNVVWQDCGLKTRDRLPLSGEMADIETAPPELNKTTWKPCHVNSIWLQCAGAVELCRSQWRGAGPLRQRGQMQMET